ncbi:hypothetical protein O4H49_07885 [Kiloniella laminariae]|uniref:Uncharacterized protein n=1 Tax=Kiloniella laminariae TaxID=454162 RepID=A0ABT4LID6_9PROT|nr:hypothetical protein [Kiloniella laminariae]MCZ4280695.1 hypothetical protein [Kiloniella laminariae]
MDSPPQSAQPARQGRQARQPLPPQSASFNQGRPQGVNLRVDQGVLQNAIDRRHVQDMGGGGFGWMTARGDRLHAYGYRDESGDFIVNGIAAGAHGAARRPQLNRAQVDYELQELFRRCPR